MRDLNDVLLDKMLWVGSKKRDNLYRQTQWGPLYSSTNQRKEGSQRTQIGHQRKLRTRTFYIGGGPANHPFYHHFSSSNGR